MNRRDLLKGLGIASVVGVAPQLLVPRRALAAKNIVAEQSGTDPECRMPYQASGSIVDWARDHVRVFGRNGPLGSVGNIPPGPSGEQRNWQEGLAYVSLPPTVCASGWGMLVRANSEQNADYVGDIANLRPRPMTVMIELAGDRTFFPSKHRQVTVKRVNPPLTHGVTSADHSHYLRTAIVDDPRVRDLGGKPDVVAVNNLLLPGEATEGGVCLPGKYEMFLEDGRFKVEYTWDATMHGAGTGKGAVQPFNAWSGGAYFFHPSNLEQFVKVLDARGLNDAFWVYGAGLTDVGVDLKVTDLHTGTVYSRSSPEGTPFQPITDVNAFPVDMATEPLYFRPGYPELSASITDLERFGLPTSTPDTQYRDNANAMRDALTLYAALGANDPDMAVGAKPFNPASPPPGFEGFSTPVSRNAYAVTVDQHNPDGRGVTGNGAKRQLVGMVIDLNPSDDSNVRLYKVPGATDPDGPYAEGGFRFVDKATGGWASFESKVGNKFDGDSSIARAKLQEIMNGQHSSLETVVGNPAALFPGVQFNYG